MAIGVAVANAILLATFAEQYGWKAPLLTRLPGEEPRVVCDRF